MLVEVLPAFNTLWECEVKCPSGKMSSGKMSEWEIMSVGKCPSEKSCRWGKNCSGTDGIATMGYCHDGILPRWDIVTMGYCHDGILSRWDIVTMGYCHDGILSRWDIVTMGYCHDGILSRWDIVTMGYCRVGNNLSGKLPSEKISAHRYFTLLAIARRGFSFGHPWQFSHFFNAFTQYELTLHPPSYELTSCVIITKCFLYDKFVLVPGAA